MPQSQLSNLRSDLRRDLDDALIALCARVEALAEGSVAGVTLCNPARTQIERALFPSLPPSFADGLAHSYLQQHNIPSVRAIATATTITCVDVANDRVFNPAWRRHCLSYGIRAVQARPIYLRRPVAYGTFVLTFGRATPETDWNAALMEFAADAAKHDILAHIENRTLADE